MVVGEPFAAKSNALKMLAATLSTYENAQTIRNSTRYITL